jgi:hypothetical protein
MVGETLGSPWPPLAIRPWTPSSDGAVKSPIFFAPHNGSEFVYVGIESNFSNTIYSHFRVDKDADWVGIPGPAIRLGQGYPPARHRVWLGLGKALEHYHHLKQIVSHS